MSETTTPPVPPGVEMYTDGGDDVIRWSNWSMPKDWWTLCFLTFALIVWTVFTAGLTIGTVIGKWPVIVSAVILPFGLMEVLLGATLLKLAARESIRVTDDAVELELGMGFRWRQIVPRDTIRALTLETNYNEESNWSLNLFGPERVNRAFRKRYLLAYWLRPRVKNELFHLLRSLFERRGWAVECRTDWATTPNLSQTS